MSIIESTLNADAARFRQVVPAGEPFMHTVKKGQAFRILDLEGNQAVDTLFYNAGDTEERYDANNTIREQGNLYLTAGSQLLSNDGNLMLTIIAASLAVREALSDAGGLLLRPLMRIEVVVPEECVGPVLGDLQARQANISGSETDMEVSVIHGECPLQSLLGYATQLRSLTRGRGQFTMEFARFDIG